MAHNIVIRKSAFPEEPFGPYRGRIGGDQHIARTAQNMQKPLAHKRELIIYHEDISYSFRTFLEQHIRSLYLELRHHPNPSRFTKIWTGIKAFPLVNLKRVWRLFRDRENLPFTFLETLLALPVLFLFALFDLFLVAILSAVPPLLDRWIHFQFRTYPS